MRTVMILAAGRGERLKPLTNYYPKAMCQVNRIPLIEYHVARLAEAGFSKIIINHAYLGGQIKRHLGNGLRWGVEILYTPEPPGGLETGGGIFNALPFLGTEPFMTVNADIFTDFPFAKLSIPEKSLLHLVLVKKPADFLEGNFALTADGRLENNPKKFLAAGICCYRPEAFAEFKPGRYSLVPMWRKFTDQGLVSGELFEGKWFDIGTPDRLQSLNTLSL